MRCVVFAVSPCPELSLTGCVWVVVIEALEGRVGTHKHNTPLFPVSRGFEDALAFVGARVADVSSLIYEAHTLHVFYDVEFFGDAKVA